MTKFEEFRDSVKQHAIKMFNKDGKLNMPVWLTEDTNGDRALFVTPFSGDLGKSIIALGLKEVFKEKDICRYIFVMEAWFATDYEYKEDHVPPSQRLDRKEALCIMGEDRDTGENCYIMMEIDRSEGKPILKVGVEKSTPFAGRFTNMFDKEFTKH